MMNKQRPVLVTIFILYAVLPLSSLAQGTSARDKFFEFFSETYSVLSQPPLVNYSDHLNSTIDLSFSNENPHFISALSETALRYRINEDAAADSLYHFAVTKLIDEKLWLQYTDIFNEYSPAFKAYNTALCPCISANIKTTDDVAKLMGVLQRCVTGFASDSTAQKDILPEAGNKTLADVFRKEQYFSLYSYQHCAPVKFLLNKSLRQQAYSRYLSLRAREKGQRATSVLTFFKDKKTDSLNLIFPGWKKFTKELAAALALYNTPAAQISAFSISNEGEKQTVVSIFTGETELGNLVVSFSGDNIYATVAKIVLEKPQVAVAPAASPSAQTEPKQ